LKACQAFKERLIQKDRAAGNDYNKAKGEFLKREAKNALHWYHKLK